MARSSGRSFGGGSRSSHAAAARSPPRKSPAKPAAQAPSPVPVHGANGGSVLGGLAAAVADGVAWGTGSALGRRIADAIMGPPVIRHESVASSTPSATPAEKTNSLGDACGGQVKALQDCLNNYGSDISKCHFYMDMMQECRKGSEAALGA